jgi:nucleoside-diphosphate-sugar epimerase
MGNMANQPRTVLVTGGTGFVGSHLVERLLSLGYTVRCLLRYPDKRRWLTHLPIEVAPGDITIPETLPQAMQGVDAVVHAAALLKAKSSEEFHRFNVQGTRNLLEACAKAPTPPRRFVYLSSVAAAGPAPPDRSITASDSPHPITNYGKSKLQSEQEVAGFKDAVETVIIRPSAVFGPRDRAIFLYFKTIATWRIKPFFGSSFNLLSVIYIADLVEALICALTAPKEQLPDYPLFVADPQVYTWAQIVADMEKALQRKALTVVIPGPIVSIVAAISELFSGKNLGTFNREKAREMLASSWWCDVQPAIDRLGWNSVTPIDQAIRHTVDWYRKQGWIK